MFTHDTEHALGTVVDLINTGSAACGVECLPDLDALDGFVQRARIGDAHRLDRGDLIAIRLLRDRFRAVFQAGSRRRAVMLVNGIIGDVRTTPHLSDHDGYDWHVHFFAPGAHLADRLAADCGMALAFVVAADELDRLRTCAAPDCERVLVDLSRNRCRRYCDSRTCGNRMHVAAYRARQREALG